MSKTFTVEGDITAVDTRTIISSQGSVTAPSQVVPSGVKKIVKIIAAASSEGLADGASIFVLRLGGNAVMKGEQTLVLSASGRIAPQAGSDSAPQVCRLFILEDCDIDITPSDTISISAEMAGTDTGTARVVVTLVYA